MSEKQVANPWRELAVIDKRAVRFSQGITALMALLGIVVSPWFFFFMVLQLLLSLTLGRKWCLACLTYYLLLQPRFGQGELEDARAPRFANIIAIVLLSLAFVLDRLTLVFFADLLALLVFLLALLAAGSGFCLGCWFYRLLARAKGVSRWRGEALDLDDFPAPGDVLFWHPLCSDCQEWKNRLPEAYDVDISQRPDLAKKYGILLVPTIYRIDEEGRVIEQLAP